MEMYKAYNDHTPFLGKSIFPTREMPYNFRNYNPLKFTNVHTIFKGTETIYFRGPKIWNLVPDNIKDAKSPSEFKTKIRDWEPVGCTCRLCNTFIPRIGLL